MYIFEVLVRSSSLRALAGTGWLFIFWRATGSSPEAAESGGKQSSLALFKQVGLC